MRFWVEGFFWGMCRNMLKACEHTYGAANVYMYIYIYIGNIYTDIHVSRKAAHMEGCVG